VIALSLTVCWLIVILSSSSVQVDSKRVNEYVQSEAYVNDSGTESDALTPENTISSEKSLQALTRRMV
jgi:hypothetical protein